MEEKEKLEYFGELDDNKIYTSIGYSNIFGISPEKARQLFASDNFPSSCVGQTYTALGSSIRDFHKRHITKIK